MPSSTIREIRPRETQSGSRAADGVEFYSAHFMPYPFLPPDHEQAD